MDKGLEFVVMQRLERTAKALRENRMEAYIAANRDEAREKLLSLLPPVCTVTHGGSVTLAECGVPEALRAGGYTYLDRGAPGLRPDEVQKLYRDAFSADCYLGSANAVTEKGEIFNVDGNGNRVAAYIFGPKSVILIVGMNKIVPDVDAALERLRSTAAPANVARLNGSAPCSKTGHCMNCRSESRICCDYVVQGYQRIPGRIKVILVAETLGY